MSERSETAPSQFSDVTHVHCLRCNAPVPIIDGTDKHGYYEGRIADHECEPF